MALPETLIQQKNKTGTGSSMDTNKERTHFVNVTAIYEPMNQPCSNHENHHQPHDLITKKLLRKWNMYESNIGSLKETLNSLSFLCVHEVRLVVVLLV